MFKFNLQQNEDLINLYRQTELVLVKPVLWVFVLIYAPWYFLIKYSLVDQFQRLLLAWSLIVLGYFINKVLLWLLNSYVLTNKRLVKIYYRTVFHKQIIETPLERILNISYETTGVFSSLLNFGNINVQVVGLTEAMVLKNIKDPGAVKDSLWQIHGSHSAKNPLFSPENIKNLEQNIGYQQESQAQKQAKRPKIV